MEVARKTQNTYLVRVVQLGTAFPPLLPLLWTSFSAVLLVVLLDTAEIVVEPLVAVG